MLKKIILSDKEIVRRIKTNDRTILGELFVANEKSISSYIKNHGGDSSDAQDMIQEAIIVLWQNVNAGRFEISAKVGTYLFAVAKNKWLAELRRRKKLIFNSDSLEMESANENALQVIVADEQKSTVARALEKLDTTCKELLTMFYFEERNMADIATLLGFANSDVAKAKKYQCKKALQKLLKG
jgi:RNA polymerase sigma factor (sigma-70 family)